MAGIRTAPQFVSIPGGAEISANMPTIAVTPFVHSFQGPIQATFPIISVTPFVHTFEGGDFGNPLDFSRFTIPYAPSVPVRTNNTGSNSLLGSNKQVAVQASSRPSYEITGVL